MRETLSQNQSERRRPGEHLAPSRGVLVLRYVITETQPPPGNDPGQTELFEVRAAVPGDPGRQYFMLPGRRRQLYPLELPDDAHDPLSPVQLAARMHMLPSEQKPKQVGSRHWLDLAS